MAVGALGDSFYEYLLKMWIYRGGRNNPGVRVDEHGRKVFDDAMAAIQEALVQTTPKSQLMYIAERKSGRLLHKMGHLACFIGGLYGLAAKGAPVDSIGEAKYLENARGIANTCHEGYIRVPTGIGPEMMEFSGAQEATSARAQDRYYILR